MRIETALKYAREISRRIHAVNGILATPRCNREAIKFRRAFVFGSTVKGKDKPNDLDVLIDMVACGKSRNYRQGSLDRRRARSMGIAVAPCSRDYALKWMTKGMKKVSRHIYEVDAEIIDIKVEIYPRYKLDQFFEASHAPARS